MAAGATPAGAPSATFDPKGPVFDVTVERRGGGVLHAILSFLRGAINPPPGRLLARSSRHRWRHKAGRGGGSREVYQALLGRARLDAFQKTVRSIDAGNLAEL